MDKKKNRNRKLLEKLLDREWEKLNKERIYLPTLNSEELKQKIKRKIESKKTKQFYIGKSLRIAASIIVISSLSTFLYYIYSPKPVTEVQAPINEQIVEIYARPGTRKKIVLPDGTRVHLNNASTLRFPKEFGKVSRLVELDGEAFFDVKRDINYPFVVNSNGLSTRVLGTSFNICSYPGENTVVTVETGKVSVKPTEFPQKQVFLTPGKQAIYDANNDTVARRNADITEYLAWRYRILNFNNITLGEAAKKMERWYNVKILFEDEKLKNDIIQGSYKNERLENVLKSFEFIHKLKVQMKENNEVIVISN
ncbi:FecR family protein [Sunxiuqinia sp. sy24]|uniref:FecR family protein n=1 Tax=Sunxiuqinia sp. sy24 TaxID=3461495 RepID=UPI00404560D7